MDRRELREKLNRALRFTLKGALVLSPATLVACGGLASRTPTTIEISLAAAADAGRLPDGGLDCTAACQAVTFLEIQSCAPKALADGGPGLACTGLQPSETCGRRPSWLMAQPWPPGAASNVVGTFFAEAHRLEAASVAAFRHLARELRAHGAPAALIARARRAAADEVRHARLTATLARRFEGRPARPVLGAAPVDRGLEAIEGCVRETHGALVAAWQARFARDAGVRRALASIAVDEARHAELGWAVATWAEPRLSPAARRRLAEARAASLEGLAGEVDRDVPLELVALAGLPGRAAGRRLAENLARELT
ncbi:MAG TPA: hypothetical protein VMB50_03660 [Myxococcales bacterium]|nr:hypothetical protein [Myxococcales bacterium]